MSDYWSRFSARLRRQANHRRRKNARRLQAFEQGQPPTRLAAKKTSGRRWKTWE